MSCCREGTRVRAQLQAAGGGSYTVSLARVRTSMQPLTCKLIQCHTNHCYSSAARTSCSVHGDQVLYARISTFLGPPIDLRGELQRLVQGMFRMDTKVFKSHWTMSLRRWLDVHPLFFILFHFLAASDNSHDGVCEMLREGQHCSTSITRYQREHWR